MACEPKVDYDVFTETQQEIVLVPVGWRVPRHGVVFSVNGNDLLALVPLAGHSVYGGEKEPWTVTRIPANGSTHLFARGRNLYGCDVVYLGRLDGIRKSRQLLELLSRTLVSFTAQCPGHGHYIHHEERVFTEDRDGVFGVDDIYGLKPGPHTLYVHKNTKSGWSTVELDIHTGVADALDVDNLADAITEVLRGYAHGL